MTRKFLGTNKNLNSFTRKPGNWVPADLDGILHNGNENYASIQTNKYFILENLPTELDG